jgi:hypothetical protein
VGHGVDIFLAKYDSGGTHLWSRAFGDTTNDTGWDVAVDGSGDVIFTGECRDTVDFGGGPMPSVGSSADAFVAKYDSNGNHQWSHRFGDFTSRGEGVTTDENENVFVTGGFMGTIDCGGGTAY